MTLSPGEFMCRLPAARAARRLPSLQALRAAGQWLVQDRFGAGGLARGSSARHRTEQRRARPQRGRSTRTGVRLPPLRQADAHRVLSDARRGHPRAAIAMSSLDLHDPRPCRRALFVRRRGQLAPTLSNTPVVRCYLQHRPSRVPQALQKPCAARRLGHPHHRAASRMPIAPPWH